MDENQNVEDKFSNSENVRKRSSRLSSLKILGNSIETQQSIEADNNRARVELFGLTEGARKEEVDVRGQDRE